MINISNLINKNKKVEEDGLKEIVNNIRALGLDMIDNASSGHIGILMGATPIITSVYANILKIDQNNPKWVNRDRFILSAGHGSAMLYATLFMSGFNISLDDLKNFRKLDSITPGHPEYNITPGVELTTGPLGTGLATSVGIAISEAYLRNYFGEDIINYYTYVLCGDGDLMEGLSYESMSLAGHLNLNKLIVLYDSNNISLDGSLNECFSENIKERCISCGWNYLSLEETQDTNKITELINNAKDNKKGPTLIEFKTIIGRYSKYEATNLAHGFSLNKEDILSIKEKLEVREQPFSISQELREEMVELIKKRNEKSLNNWNKKVLDLDDKKKKDLEDLINNKKIKINNINYSIPENKVDSLRNVSSLVLNEIAVSSLFFMGGSADVKSSTKSFIKDSTFTKDNRCGRTINFGVREGLMGCIANGLALSNITPFISTFLTFSDFLRPSIRLAAMMNLPVIYIFTHDSITVGEDGPTHQAVEQLDSLRLIPNLEVYRPSDANELLGVYKTVLERQNPSAIILSRNEIKISDVTDSSKVSLGGYITNKEKEKLEGIIISNGEEFDLANKVYEKLIEKGYNIRLVSMPSLSLFEKNNKEYQKEILPNNVKTFVIEYSKALSWYKYIDNEENLFNVDNYGISASKEDILDKFNLTIDKIVEKIEKILSKK